VNNLKLIIPIAPSGNRMWRKNNKTGKTYKTDECKYYQNYIGHIAKKEAKKQGWVKTVKEKVIIYFWFYWPDARQRDTGNQKKVILDGLQGVLYDNDCWVLERDQDFNIDRADPRVEIEILKKSEDE